MGTADFYYRARMMDSSLGRFSGKDKFLYLNRYFYVMNDPLYWVDSKGEWLHIPVLAAIGAVIGAVSALVAGEDAEDVAKSAVIGAVGGAVCAATGGLGSVGGAIAGGAATVGATAVLYGSSDSENSGPINPLTTCEPHDVAN